MAGFDGFYQRPKRFYNRQNSNSAMDGAIDCTGRPSAFGLSLDFSNTRSMGSS
jgi:hypothetical protein